MFCVFRVCYLYVKDWMLFVLCYIADLSYSIFVKPQSRCGYGSQNELNCELCFVALCMLEVILLCCMS